MWLLAIEIVAALIASARGWGWKPFALIGGSFVFGFIGGLLFGTDATSCLNIVDIVITIALVVMAIAGYKKPVSQETEGLYLFACPYCAENVKLGAKICKYCGHNLPPAYVIPMKYSFEQLTDVAKNEILRNDPSKNLKLARKLIEQKDWHKAIGSLQAVTMKASVDSKEYGNAYLLLHKLLYRPPVIENQIANNI